nr:MAG TPA: hypothetical protein [Bacteriophage sp.]
MENTNCVNCTYSNTYVSNLSNCFFKKGYG